MLIDNNIQNVPDSFQAFLIEDARLTNREEYPILEKAMISKDVPAGIMSFNKAISFQGNLSRTFICFYEPDETFERIRRNPRRYLSFFKRTAGIIGFDFSIHSDMPIIKQKSQMNDNLSLTYFYGKNGIPIIPNLRCGIDELTEEFLEAIPDHELVAVGTHGFIKTKQERHEWFCFLEHIIRELNPPKIIIYGTLPGKMFDVLKDRQEFVLFDSWIAKRSKEARANGN